jgi:hypothetical protein
MINDIAVAVSLKHEFLQISCNQQGYGVKENFPIVRRSKMALSNYDVGINNL